MSLVLYAQVFMNICVQIKTIKKSIVEAEDHVYIYVRNANTSFSMKICYVNIKHFKKSKNNVF